MPENVALILRFHLMGGEDVSVVSGDFEGEPGAVAAIARAVDERHSLVLIRARYDRETDVNGMVINLANSGVGACVEDRQRRSGPVPIAASRPGTP